MAIWRAYEVPPAAKSRIYVTQLRFQASFRRAYLRLMLHRVVADQHRIEISGAKTTLARQAAANDPLAPVSVLTSD
ncbi:MAG: hypothetical protein WAU68_17030 [Vitreimonas sp.]